jgi:hypothetical protein
MAEYMVDKLWRLVFIYSTPLSSNYSFMLTNNFNLQLWS